MPPRLLRSGLMRRATATEAALRLLGLAARAGAVLSGTERVREGARNGSVAFVLLAEDGSPTQRDKLQPLLAAKGVQYRTGGSRAELGLAIGRAPASAVGITDARLAERIAALVDSAG